VIDGALLVDKPVGPTTNAVLQTARKLFGAAKAGHAGTLDPLASGLVLALFGEATKFAGPALEADKEYLATLKLGERTSTGDAEGEVVARKDVRTDEAAMRQALAAFRGEIEQIPPMYSALKREGVPLYKLARRGEVVERAPRRVRIGELELAGFRPPLADLRVRCSKGTYVRTLAEDIGEALGTGAHLAALRRTASGPFRVEQAITLDSLEALPPESRLARLLPVAVLLAGLPRADLDAAGETRLRQGQAVGTPGLAEGVHGVFGPAGGVIGLGRVDSGGVLHPLRLTQPAENNVESRP
jgi:tRNA pseudouridine55 synthase